MNDDVLACIGQFADADARRAMGLPPNRLPLSNDSRYDCLNKMLAQERRIVHFVEKDGASDWDMCIRTDNYCYSVRIAYDRDGKIKILRYVYGPERLWHFWVIRWRDDGNHESLYFRNVGYFEYKSVWQDGRWVRLDGDTY
jgi:hypothetical protein